MSRCAGSHEPGDVICTIVICYGNAYMNRVRATFHVVVITAMCQLMEVSVLTQEVSGVFMYIGERLDSIASY